MTIGGRTYLLFGGAAVATVLYIGAHEWFFEHAAEKAPEVSAQMPSRAATADMRVSPPSNDTGSEATRKRAPNNSEGKSVKAAAAGSDEPSSDADATLVVKPGREAVSNSAEIDWSMVHLRSPIPGLMPALESDDPFQAGFAREWIQRSLGRAEFESLVHDGRSTRILAQPFALGVVSERRLPEDSWAHGVDYELRRFVDSRVSRDEAPTVRVFCSSRGCLCYFESSLSTWREIIGALKAERALEPFGVGPTGYQFGSHMINGDKSRWWTLILIARPVGQ